MIDTVKRLLFGDDIYISYSRRDAANYAATLANQLTKKGFSCYLDQLASPSKDLPDQLARKLRESGALIVIGTEEGIASELVKKEVEEFLKTKKLIIPISIDGALERSSWSYLVEGIPIAVETKDAFLLGSPSPSIIQRIEQSSNLRSRRKRLTRVTLFWFLLSLAAPIMTLLLSPAFREFINQIPRGVTEPSQTPLRGVIVVLFIVLTLILFLGISPVRSTINRLLQSIGVWFKANILAYSGVDLRRYQRALLSRYQKINFPFGSSTPLSLREAYVPLKLRDPSDNTIDAFRAILEHRSLVITGPPGCGKSTLLKVIAHTYAEDHFDDLPDRPVPVLLEVPQLLKDKRPIKWHLKEVLTHNDVPESDSFISRNLANGKLMVLLDGLDEIADNERSEIMHQIRKLLVSYPNCRYIITSRTSTYKENIPVDQTLQVAEFDDQQIQQFIRSWGVHMPTGKSSEHLVRMMHERPHVLELARNPLLLTLILYLYSETDSFLARSTAEFYQFCTDLLLRGSYQQRSSTETRNKKQILEHLALFYQDENGKQNTHKLRFDYEAALDQVREILPQYRGKSGQDTRDLLDDIIEHSGLLVPRDVNSHLRFAHLSFQEFFAASKLRNDSDGLFIRFQDNAVYWFETAKMWCELSKDSTRFLQRTFADYPIETFELLSHAQKVDPSFAKKVVDEFKSEFMESRRTDVLERTFASVAANSDILGESVFSFLEDILSMSQDTVLRIAAANALSLTNLPKAAKILSSYYDELYQIHQMLVRMGDAAVPSLMALAQQGYSEALEDLRAIGTPLAIKGLSSLVPLLHKKIRTITDLKIEFESRNGFYVNQDDNVRLKVSNLSRELLQDIIIELDDTAKYTVKDSQGQRRRKLEQLRRGESIVIEYPIIVTEPGLVTLQLKVNGAVYKDPSLEIHAVKDNPYFYGPPVKRSYNFFGRETEIQTILNNIMRSSGTHTMIIGEQRSGKTSILFRIRELLETPYIPIFISFSGIERDEKSALNWLLDEIIRGIKKTGILQDKNYSISLKYSNDFTVYLEQITKDIKTFNSESKLVLLLDEAHLMNEIDERFQEVLREAFIQLVDDIRVVLACYYDFFDDLRASGSPLHNIFEFIFLKPLEGEALTDLIVKPAAHFGYQYAEKVVENIGRMSGGHPYYCQFLCAKSFGEAEQSATKVITHAHVKVASEKVLSSDKQRFKLGYWNSLKVDERLFLRNLAAGEPTPGISKEVINRLRNKFIIRESKGQYSFTASLFEGWVKQLTQEES